MGGGRNLGNKASQSTCNHIGKKDDGSLTQGSDSGNG